MNLSENVKVRVDEETRAWLEALAAAESRTVSAMIRVILERVKNATT